MKIVIDSAFEKDTKKIRDKKVKIKLANAIEKIISLQKLSDIPNCKKLKGSTNAYRIRIGDYRAGFFFKYKTVQFVRFVHRKDIYNVFP